jgi:hypothetical protein
VDRVAKTTVNNLPGPGPAIKRFFNNHFIVLLAQYARARPPPICGQWGAGDQVIPLKPSIQLGYALQLSWAFEPALGVDPDAAIQVKLTSAEGCTYAEYL